MDKHHIILALGSNHHADTNIPRAISILGRGMVEMTISTPLCNPAIGISAPDFTNCIISAFTDMDIETLTLFVKETEREIGRTSKDKQRGLITIDIDIMQFDKQRYHHNDWQRPYVIAGLVELSLQ